MSKRPTRKVICPQCGRDAVYSPENRWRPFCSERCRMIDLGHWASESYRLPAQDDALSSGSIAAPESGVLSSDG